MKSKNAIKNRGDNAVYDFTIVSRDYDGMERAYESLPHNLRRTQCGTGFCLLGGERDHHFACRGIDRARHIVNHYRRLLRKRKRGGFKVWDNYAFDAEEKFA